MNSIHEQLKDVFGSYLYDYIEKGNKIYFSVDTLTLLGSEVCFLVDIFVDFKIEVCDDNFHIRGTVEA